MTPQEAFTFVLISSRTACVDSDLDSDGGPQSLAAIAAVTPLPAVIARLLLLQVLSGWKPDLKPPLLGPDPVS